MKNILLAVGFIIMLTSCKKEEQATIVGTWIMIDVYEIDKGVKQPSIFSYWSDCSKDDEWTYTAAGDLLVTEGAFKCYPEVNSSEPYVWEKFNKKLIINGGHMTDVLELTPSTLKIIPNPTARLQQVRVFRRK